MIDETGYLCILLFLCVYLYLLFYDPILQKWSLRNKNKSANNVNKNIDNANGDSKTSATIMLFALKYLALIGLIVVLYLLLTDHGLLLGISAVSAIFSVISYAVTKRKEFLSLAIVLLSIESALTLIDCYEIFWVDLWTKEILMYRLLHALAAAIMICGIEFAYHKSIKSSWFADFSLLVSFAHKATFHQNWWFSTELDILVEIIFLHFIAFIFARQFIRKRRNKIGNSNQESDKPRKLLPTIFKELVTAAFALSLATSLYFWFINDGITIMLYAYIAIMVSILLDKIKHLRNTKRTKTSIFLFLLGAAYAIGSTIFLSMFVEGVRYT